MTKIQSQAEKVSERANPYSTRRVSDQARPMHKAYSTLTSSNLFFFY